MDTFLDNLNESLFRIDSTSDKVLLGDFNIDFSVQQKNANFPLKRSLRGITEAFDLKQLIMEPTRVTEYSETLIYLVFTNSHHKVVESGVFDLGLSDHSLVSLNPVVPELLQKLSNIVHTRTTTKTLSLKILRIFPDMSFLITPTTWTTVLTHGISCF